jgi:small conductance mechanosensitive channel
MWGGPSEDVDCHCEIRAEPHSRFEESAECWFSAWCLRSAASPARARVGHFCLPTAQRTLERQKVDPRLLRYVGTMISVLANIALVIAILGYFCVETTSFAASLAGAGLAIGTAWGGLLSNFAAGAFLVILRPYKVGDFVSAGDVVGTVTAIGLFVTTLDTPDGVQTHVGNNKILSTTVQNFSANPLRRVDLTAQLHYSVNVEDAIARIKAKVAGIANVSESSPPSVEILTFSEFGPVLAVRPFTHTDHYWQVYFETNKAIVSVAGEASFPPVEHNLKLRTPPTA